MTETTTTIVGVFDTRDDARQAIQELRTAGYSHESIGFVSRRPDGSLERDGTEDSSYWEEGTGIGAAVGAAAGTGLGLAVMAGLLTPVGPVIAGGALIALLASAGAGATVGSVVGGLIGLGVPEDDAEYFETELNRGKSLVTVATASRTAQAIDILHHSGGLMRV